MMIGAAKRLAVILAVLVGTLGMAGIARAAPAALTKTCQWSDDNTIRDCVVVATDDVDPLFVNAVKGKVISVLTATICGTEDFYKNGNLWQEIPTCVDANATTTLTVAVGRTVDPGTTFCTQFVSDDATYYPLVCSTVTGAAPASVDSIDSASGCNTIGVLKQCIYVNGTANFVNYIQGTEYGISTGQICGFERLLQNGVIIKSVSGCVPKGTGSKLVVKWNFNTSYASGTVFCTQFTTNAGTKGGKPCETIQ